MPKQGKIGSPEPIAALNKVKILELTVPWEQRETLVDVRTYCKDIVWAEHVCPYLRLNVANMLNAAQNALPSGYKLRAGTALRTLNMQKNGWDGYFKRMREEHPEWPLSALRRATNKFFAPYDQPAPPGHCTGGAVDVGIQDAEGNVLNLIAPTEGWQAAYTWSDLISEESRRNRMMMVEAMLGAGFSNCRDEYWHYSWGDSAWAVRTGETTCPYGWTYPPVALEANYEGATACPMEISFTRDANGKPESADGCVELQPGQTDFSFGLYWANGVNVNLAIQIPTHLPIPAPLWKSNNRENWELVDTFEKLENRLILSITPTYDRIFLTNIPPPPVKEEQPASSA